MTQLRTRIELVVLIISVSAFIFFTPFVLGQKQPAIEASIKQNMTFLDGMVKKYHERFGKYPDNIDTLVNDARKNSYNKTLFNPILKNGGDANNRQIIVKYSDVDYKKIFNTSANLMFSGKTGYYTDGKKYVIYGHLKDGSLLQTQDGPLKLGDL